MKFEPIIPNPDLDVHPDPPGLWQHVAVVCLWKDAHAQRKLWPHAAMIGPLRTVRGVDELVRGLLHNPQIHLLVVTGSDQSPDEEASTLFARAIGRGEGLAEDLREHGKILARTVSHVYASDLAESCDLREVRLGETMSRHLADVIPKTDPRPKVTLPPPTPDPTAGAPHGDPGERVAASTLAELWPLVLHRAMRFGRLMPTQYGMTREVLCLTAVVRDVEKSLSELRPNPYDPALFKEHLAKEAEQALRDQFVDAGPTQAPTQGPEQRHPVLGLTWKQVEAYRDQVTGVADLGDRPYSYGSRMRGARGQGPEPELRSDGNYTISFGPPMNFWPDQIANVEKLLAASPDTRAAFLTPWRPPEDSGKESGRPCLTGVWFRVEATGCGRRDCNGCALCADKSGSIIPGGQYGVLHLVVAFRSHDLFAGWPVNLAGLCLWQSDLARKLGMRPGSLTCTSYSAHIYERDWNAANEVVAKHHDTNREPAWDQRTSWYVQKIPPVVEEKPIVVGEMLDVPRPASGVIDRWEIQEEPAGPGMVVGLNQTSGERARIPERMWRERRGDYRGPQPKPTLRATALTPDGSEVVAVFEAETAEALRAMIERSGLVTSIGAAMWLGDEIRKLAGPGGQNHG